MHEVLSTACTPAFLILQSVRDAMIVTSCGAEALPLISAFGVLPASVLFIMYYDKLVSRINRHCPLSCAGADSSTHHIHTMHARKVLSVLLNFCLHGASRIHPVGLKYCTPL